MIICYIMDVTSKMLPRKIWDCAGISEVAGRGDDSNVPNSKLGSRQLHYSAGRAGSSGRHRMDIAWIPKDDNSSAYIISRSCALLIVMGAELLVIAPRTHV
jgi:hypothetical protein